MPTRFVATLYERAGNGTWHRLATVYNYHAFLTFLAGAKQLMPLSVFTLYAIGPAKVGPTSPLAERLHYERPKKAA